MLQLIKPTKINAGYADLLLWIVNSQYSRSLILFPVLDDKTILH